MMSVRPVAMISSTARDLPEHREQVRLACEQAGFAPHEMMENLPALDANAVEASLKMVDDADAYIGIFAFRYGYVPNGADISVTEIEYNRAIEKGKLRLIFIMDEDHPIKSSMVEIGEGAIKLAALKKRALEDRVTGFFKSPDDLRALVIASLSKCQSNLISKREPGPALSTEQPTAFWALRSNSQFVGREKTLEKIISAVKYGQALITTLSGMGGIGKTDTAIKAIHTMIDEGTVESDVLFVDLKGFTVGSEPLTPLEAIETLLRQILPASYELPKDNISIWKLWYKILSDKSPLLFLDNAYDEDQIRDILPRRDESKVIVTSRKRIILDSLNIIDIDFLNDEDSKHLALLCGNVLNDNRISEDQARSIAKICGNLPLSIKIISSSLGTSLSYNIDSSLKKLEEKTRLLHLLDRPKLAVGLSLMTLEPNLRKLWRQLSVFEGDFSSAAAGAVWSIDEPTFALAKLEQVSLLSSDGQDRHRLHDLLRAIALEELSKYPEEGKIAQIRCVTYYCNILSKISDLYRDAIYNEESNIATARNKIHHALGIYDIESNNIISSQKWCSDHYLDDIDMAQIVYKFYEGMCEISSIRMPTDTMVSWTEDALMASKKMWPDDRVRLSSIQHMLGFYHVVNKAPGKGLEYLLIARDFLEHHTNSNLWAYLLNNIGFAYKELNKHDEALQYQRQALRLSEDLESIDMRMLQNRIMNGIGYSLAMLGNMTESIRYHEMVIERLDTIVDHRAEIFACSRLGQLFELKGRIGEATVAFRKVLEINETFGSPYTWMAEDVGAAEEFFKKMDGNTDNI